MSDCKSVSRYRSWYVSHTLYTSLQPDTALQLRPPSTVPPWTLFWNLFNALFQRVPDTVFYIHVRVSRAEFDQCVACGSSGSALPDLPFTAVIQATSALHLAKLQSFLPGAAWTHVGVKTVFRSTIPDRIRKPGRRRVPILRPTRTSCPRQRRKRTEAVHCSRG